MHQNIRSPSTYPATGISCPVTGIIHDMKKSTRLILSATAVTVLVSGFLVYRRIGLPSERTLRLLTWLKDPQAAAGWMVPAGQNCGNAPFLFPSTGLIGYLWDDSFQAGKRHQGIDIFAPTGPGQTPVIAAYDGYLTRLESWKSSLIIRVPEDPLQPGRQIWIYTTHMADPDGNSFISAEFPPGTTEKFVQAGTLLGFQGNYSGDTGNPVGVHLHFSIVRDDGQGRWLNELKIQNTLDPSPYLGMDVNNNHHPELPVLCHK